MAVIADKFYLHITAVPKTIGIERRTFSSAVLDQLPSLVGDQSGHAQVEITRRYFRNLPFVIAADDNFSTKDWRVTSVINDRWFRGALVVMIERNRDLAGRPFIGDTFLDGLTEEECKVGAPIWDFLLVVRSFRIHLGRPRSVVIVMTPDHTTGK